MRVLIVEDEFVSRALLLRFLSSFADVDVAVDGREALTAFAAALDAGDPYDLICLDIGLPELDGHSVLQSVRDLEDERNISQNVKVFMTTSRSDAKTIVRSFFGGCEGYLVKPVEPDEDRALDARGVRWWLGGQAPPDHEEGPGQDTEQRAQQREDQHQPQLRSEVQGGSEQERGDQRPAEVTNDGDRPPQWWQSRRGDERR